MCSRNVFLYLFLSQPVNGHVNVETQNPRKIQDIALQSLEEYRADIEEEDRQERKKVKTKSKVGCAFISSL